MAISVTPTVKGTMALDEFVSFCKANVRYDDEDSIMSAAEPLAALANDDMLLVNAINSELYRSIENRGNARVLSTQSLLLHIDPIFKVRANIWKKPVERTGAPYHDNAVYSYEYAHNHNFQLLTVGYLGSGYWTDIHECDPDKIVGYIGERVELRHLERTSLPRGKVLLYRTLKDVHTQRPPEEFSISLNLIVGHPTGHVADQYNFDLETSTIQRMVSMPMGSYLSVLTFAAILDSRSNLDATVAVATSEAHWRVRLAAFQCSAVLAKDEAKTVWAKAVHDPHPRIRDVAGGYLTQS